MVLGLLSPLFNFRYPKCSVLLLADQLVSASAMSLTHSASEPSIDIGKHGNQVNIRIDFGLAKKFRDLKAHSHNPLYIHQRLFRCPTSLPRRSRVLVGAHILPFQSLPCKVWSPLPRSRSTTASWEDDSYLCPLSWIPQRVQYLLELLLHMCSVLQWQAWLLILAETLPRPVHLWRLSA